MIDEELQEKMAEYDSMEFKKFSPRSLSDKSETDIYTPAS